MPVATASVSGTIQLTGDLGGSASSPTVTKLSGVSLSGTPSAGQALVATSSSSAGWQTVSTGGATNPNAGTVWNTTTDPASGSTASSVKDGDMWGDGSTDPTKVLLKVRVSGQWVVTAELTKPTVTTTSPPQASVNPTVTDTSVTLSWTAPSQVAGTLDGYNVYQGSSTTPLNTALIPASTTSFTTTTPLTPGTSYNFVIKAVSTPTGGSQTESAGLTIQATTTGTVVNPLPAPTGVTATAGNATASVAFNLVTGATSYTVTATPGGINKIGSTSPITVDGLANGTSYTFTVSATDGTRTSAESTATIPVTPTGIVNGDIIYQDNFSGSTLNTAYWQAMSWPKGAVNEEAQTYVPEQNFVENNMLIIRAQKRQDGEWYSGRVEAIPVTHVTSGRFEAEILIPLANGVWPAFWLLPWGGGGWPDTGEIDILEAINTESLAHMNIHSSYDRPSLLKSTPIDASVWHKYAVDVREDRMKVYIDDVIVVEVTPSENVGAWPYSSNPFGTIFNLAIGGVWPGRLPDAGVDLLELKVRNFIQYR